MTKETFDIKQKAIIIPVYVDIDGITNELEFIVDTGTSETLICERAIRLMGYTRVDSIEDVPIQTVSGSATAYRYIIDNIKALGLTRHNSKVISHTMPSDAGVDGLLGLDFFENTELTIDFKRAEIRVVSE
jgi:predicted aspartyl protease